MSDYYKKIKDWSLKYWWIVFIVGIITNVLLINTFTKSTFIYRFILPFTGTMTVMAGAFLLEKKIEKSKVVRYVEYCGKYSLQFYLFTFCYPIIRNVIVTVLHITNPFIILLSVFILQLIAITIIVEITRKVRFLKIPCGY